MADVSCVALRRVPPGKKRLHLPAPSRDRVTGDEAEYGNVDKFIEHLRDVELDARWVAARRGVVVSYRSGDDRLETKFLPEDAGGGNTEEGLLHRTVNGEWPYLPEGLDRDNPLEQMGRTGELEKNGATLATRPGIMT